MVYRASPFSLFFFNAQKLYTSSKYNSRTTYLIALQIYRVSLLGSAIEPTLSMLQNIIYILNIVTATGPAAVSGGRSSPPLLAGAGGRRRRLGGSGFCTALDSKCFSVFRYSQFVNIWPFKKLFRSNWYNIWPKNWPIVFYLKS